MTLGLNTITNIINTYINIYNIYNTYNAVEMFFFWVAKMLMIIYACVCRE